MIIMQISTTNSVKVSPHFCDAVNLTSAETAAALMTDILLEGLAAIRDA